MISRKIAMSGLSILSALTIMSASAFAAFTASATSNGSTFSSGNPSLQICNDNGNNTMGACAGQIPNPINVTDLVPGVNKTFKFWLNNTGTDSLTPLSTVFSGMAGTGVGGTGHLETDLNVAIDCTTGGAQTGGTIGSNGFSTYESAGQTFTSGSLAAGANTQCTLTVGLPSGNTADVNQSMNFNATFNGSAGL